jgi:lincosamide nucleotidyltransferase A/C/D/E
VARRFATDRVATKVGLPLERVTVRAGRADQRRTRQNRKLMLEPEVLEVLTALEEAGCRFWVAGGWGVDALVGAQTREHRDLDLAIDATREADALTALAGLGYAVETDWRPARVQLAAEGARWVDLHPVRFTADGAGRQADLKGGCFEYPPGCFTTGRIGGRAVPCLSPEQQLRFRRGYALRAVDRQDIARLTAAMPPVQIRPSRAADRDAVVELSLRAWAPNYASMEAVLGDELSRRLHGEDWRAYQARSVIEAVTESANHSWVADRHGRICGFVVAAVVDPGRGLGEIAMLAVDPAAQGHGVGRALTDHATDWLRAVGMRVAMIGTGGDAGHAAARRLYERAGYSPMPMARYFKAL